MSWSGSALASDFSRPEASPAVAFGTSLARRHLHLFSVAARGSDAPRRRLTVGLRRTVSGAPRAGDRCLGFIAVVLSIVGFACSEAPADREDFGRPVLARDGWSLRERSDDSDCLQLAPIGTAYSSWSCTDRPADRSMIVMVGGVEQTVVYGRAGAVIKSVVVLSSTDGVGSEETEVVGGLFLAVLRPGAVAISIRGLDRAGEVIVTESLDRPRDPGPIRSRPPPG